MLPILTDLKEGVYQTANFDTSPLVYQNLNSDTYPAFFTPLLFLNQLMNPSISHTGRLRKHHFAMPANPGLNIRSIVLLLLSVIALLPVVTSCDNVIDYDNGNVPQYELNREKYRGVPMEFWSGNPKDWEENLWGEGVGASGRTSAFCINFPKCDLLFATVPMLKDVDITANGVMCNLTDMLSDRYNEDIYLVSVTMTERGSSYIVSGKDLEYEWNAVSFGRYMKISYSQIDYYFPPNPSNSPRYFTLKISYSGQYPTVENPDSTYTPQFDLYFRQLGNNNHTTTIQ